MKKIALLLVVAAFAVSPAVAASKHKKAAPKQDDTFAKQSANTMRILRDGAPLVLPTWSLPIYFGMNMDTTQTHKVAKKHSKKKKM
jgi:hypothetical protein